MSKINFQLPITHSYIARVANRFQTNVSRRAKQWEIPIPQLQICTKLNNFVHFWGWGGGSAYPLLGNFQKKGYGNRLVGMIENLKNQGRARSMGRVVLKLDHPEINLVLDEKVWLSISWIITIDTKNQQFSCFRILDEEKLDC